MTVSSCVTVQLVWLTILKAMRVSPIAAREKATMTRKEIGHVKCGIIFR